mgnify:CR=1 FL=1
MLQLEIDDTRRYIQNKQNLLSNISNNYENYYYRNLPHSFFSFVVRHRVGAQ